MKITLIMHRILKTMALILTLSFIMASFTACSLGNDIKLLGKYSEYLNGSGEAIEFKIGGKVVYYMDNVEYEGKYSLNDAGDEITLNFDNGLLAAFINGTSSLKIEDDKIELDFGTYYKTN